MNRRIEVGLSEREVDHINALCAKFTAELRHFQGFGLIEKFKSGRKSHVW